MLKALTRRILWKHPRVVAYASCRAVDGGTGATLAIHLSIRNLAYIERALTPHYGADCPVVVAYRITWPDQMIIRGTLSTIAKKVREAKLTRTALILVGRVLDAHDFRDSALYDADHEHVLRNRKTAKAS